MKGKRRFLASVTIFCFGLIGLSGWLTLNPITVFAASCTASCPGRSPVRCGGGNATVCTAIDGSGCTSNRNGAEAKSCNSSEGGGGIDPETPEEN